MPGRPGLRRTRRQRAFVQTHPAVEVVVQQGSDPDEVFEQEVLPEIDAVYRFALRLAGDADRAEDLTQETFLRAYRTRDRYTPGTRVRSWLFTICRNVHLRAAERGRRLQEIFLKEAGSDIDTPGSEPALLMDAAPRDPESQFWDQLVDGEVLAAVDGLPPAFREVVALSDIEGLPQPQIAEILEVPVGTVKSRLFRARKLLRDELRRYAQEQGIISTSA